MLLMLSFAVSLSGCSCARRHELPLKPGMSMDEVESILTENGYVDVPTQWTPYSSPQGFSGAIALYRPRKKSRRFVVIDWRSEFRLEEGDGIERAVGGPLLLHRFAYGVSKELYVSTPLQELWELLDAQETAGNED